MFSGTFLDVNHFPGMVKSSNLFLRHANTSVDVVDVVDVVEGLYVINHAINHSRDVPETMILAQNLDFWHISGRKSLSRDSSELKLVPETP